MSIDPTEIPPEVAAEQAADRARADAAVAALRPELERLQTEVERLRAAGSPEPATAPAQDDAAAPTGPGAATDTRDAAQGLSERWRVGRDFPDNLYRVTEQHPDGQDIGRMDTAELAAQVVEAVNAQLAAPGWVADDIEAIESLLGDSGHLELISSLRSVVDAARDRDRLEQILTQSEALDAVRVEQLESERDALFARGERYRVEAERLRRAVRQWQADTARDHRTIADRALIAALHQQETTDG